jgi:ABC-type dipeptide/oligopeptide/nickel transport system ATPase subunit
VQLTTERESKTGKGKKHSVNLSIKSGKKDGALLERGLEGFSGGETDRISLGFSSAITGFSPFPMLLLDECISSLDSDMKDKTIRALRVQAKRLNKSIILVCHDAVEGLFDHVCELE